MTLFFSTHQKQTVDPTYDALDEAGHRDRYMLPELPIKYPKLIVELFIPGPLRQRKKKPHKKTQIY